MRAIACDEESVVAVKKGKDGGDGGDAGVGGCGDVVDAWWSIWRGGEIGVGGLVAVNALAVEYKIAGSGGKSKEC